MLAAVIHEDGAAVIHVERKSESRRKNPSPSSPLALRIHFSPEALRSASLLPPFSSSLLSVGPNHCLELASLLLSRNPLGKTFAFPLHRPRVILYTLNQRTQGLDREMQPPFLISCRRPLLVMLGARNKLRAAERPWESVPT